jgi:hypothetical protein
VYSDSVTGIRTREKAHVRFGGGVPLADDWRFLEAIIVRIMEAMAIFITTTKSL